MSANFNLPGGAPILGGFNPNSTVAPASTVELSFSCRDLINADTFSKSDPFLVVHQQNPKTNQWIELFRTETIQDNLDPVWHKKLVIEYRFEERQVMMFSVYDRDTASNNLQEQDYLGQMQCTLGEIVAKQSTGFTKILTDGKKGTLSVVAEELLNSKEEVTLEFSGLKLKKMNWFFAKSDPFLEISKSTESSRYILVHRTEFLKKTLNPRWKPFHLKAGSLCNGDYERDLKFEIFDWEFTGAHKSMGVFHTTLSQLIEGPGSRNIYDVLSSGGKKQGTLHLEQILVKIVPSFLDFIKGGMQMNFTVAVDFTASNGPPHDTRSLHYRSPSGRPNQYMTAIQSVGEIIQDYDSDNQYPALGFGARIPPNGQVSHEFFLNLSDSPYCSGIDGVLAAYMNALFNVQLYGPTNFAPVIRHVTRFASAYQNDPSNYFVLLIITDGVITDLDATKNAVIAASTLPMSIIIVGVGTEDFSAMDELDSDDVLLSCGDRIAKRDIVQFVELQKFIQPGGGWSKDLLAREVLAEIPDQVVGYMKDKGFKPSTPVLGASAPRF